MTFNQLYPFRHGSANQILLNRNDNVIRWSVENFGEYSESEVDIFRALCQDKIVLDVGANFGCHTLALSGIARSVVAIEPQPFIFQALCANLALNSVTNVEPLHVACGATTSWTHLPILNPTSEQNFGCIPALDHPEGQQVQVVALDDLGLRHVDFIKIDIEGNELKALQGAEGLIDRYSPILYLEFTSNRGPILDWLFAHNYVPIRHIPMHNREPNYLQAPIAGTIQEMAASDMLLAYRQPPAIPNEWLQERQFTIPSTEDLWGPRAMRVFLEWPTRHN